MLEVVTAHIMLGRHNIYLVQNKQMAKLNPIQYLREVKREASKVTWPTRKETMITTLMVFIMAASMSVFFLLVDQGLAIGIKVILGLGG